MIDRMAPHFTLEGIVSRFESLNVVVVGDTMLDRYLCGTTRRLCPDAPAPVVDVTSEPIDLPGGAANSAANAALLGARVQLVSVLGADDAGRRLDHLLRQRHVDTSGLIRTSRPTLLKQRIVAGHQVLVRCDSGCTEPIHSAVEHQLFERLEKALRNAHVVLVSDYAYGVLTPRFIAHLAQWHRRHPDLVLAVDARDLSQYADASVTVVKPNLREASCLWQQDVAEPAECLAEIVRSPEQFLDICATRIAAVTLDANGAMILERQRPPFRIAASRVPSVSVSGAGDTYMASFALSLAAGASTRQSAELAGLAAGVAVEKPLTATCSSNELLRRVDPYTRAFADGSDLDASIRRYREEGRRIVLTCGCFDILHRGHVTYLSQAKALGDILVVAVNSDASVSRLKGPTRPVNSLSDRLCVLAALGCVDHLVSFDEDRPDEIIRRVRPDLFVKGGDYRRDTVAEASLVESLGGQVEILPLVDDRSTSRLIQQIHGHAIPVGSSEQRMEV